MLLGKSLFDAAIIWQAWCAPFMLSGDDKWLVLWTYRISYKKMIHWLARHASCSLLSYVIRNNNDHCVSFTRNALVAFSLHFCYWDLGALNVVWSFYLCWKLSICSGDIIAIFCVLLLWWAPFFICISSSLSSLMSAYNSSSKSIWYIHVK